MAAHYYTTHHHISIYSMGLSSSCVSKKAVLPMSQTKIARDGVSIRNNFIVSNTHTFSESKLEVSNEASGSNKPKNCFLGAPVPVAADGWEVQYQCIPNSSNHSDSLIF